jgi:hypothetical protein
MTELALSAITDSGAQQRVELSLDTVNDYAEDMLRGVKFPPVVVFFDGTTYHLGDGFHRVAAAKKAGLEVIDVDVRQGTARDALFYGIGANAAHGLRRSAADRRRAIESLLRDPEWGRLPDRRLAEIANVDHKTIGKYRKELTGGEIPQAKSKKAGCGTRIPHGEIPQTSGKGNTSDSTLDAVLKTLSDSALVAECNRRGFTVGRRDA